MYTNSAARQGFTSPSGAAVVRNAGGLWGVGALLTLETPLRHVMHCIANHVECYMQDIAEGTLHRWLLFNAPRQRVSRFAPGGAAVRPLNTRAFQGLDTTPCDIDEEPRELNIVTSFGYQEVQGRYQRREKRGSEDRVVVAEAAERLLQNDLQNPSYCIFVISTRDYHHS